MMRIICFRFCFHRCQKKVKNLKDTDLLVLTEGSGKTISQQLWKCLSLQNIERSNLCSDVCLSIIDIII